MRNAESNLRNEDDWLTGMITWSARLRNLLPTFRAWRGGNLRNVWCRIAVPNNGKRRKCCKM